MDAPTKEYDMSEKKDRLPEEKPLAPKLPDELSDNDLESVAAGKAGYGFYRRPAVAVVIRRPYGGRRY
jgi:hypothetical protein